MKKKINLALQGGGAHGAFAWGILDKLLEEDCFDFDGICACSAGALNAVALAYGLHLGGAEKAREVLDTLWSEIHLSGLRNNPVRANAWEQFWGTPVENSLSYAWFDTMTRFFSPYQLNPFDLNPLSDILDRVIDFDALQCCEATSLYISATHVASGRVNVFDTCELTKDVVLASACLPFIFKAVEIEGEHYWDGGYMGNPSLYPLFYKNDTRDIMIVHINPMVREALPRDTHEIMNRVNEITFNSSLIKDMRAIAFVKKLLEKDMLKEEYRDQFKHILLHSIRADQALLDYSVASKFNTDMNQLNALKQSGRDTMQAWLDEHFDAVGQRDTVDLNSEFLCSIGEFFKKN